MPFIFLPGCNIHKIAPSLFISGKSNVIDLSPIFSHAIDMLPLLPLLPLLLFAVAVAAAAEQ